MPRRKPAPKAKTKTERKRDAKKRALPAALRQIIDHPDRIKVGRPTDYTPEACNQVVALMERGLSLTASAGIMGITRGTIHTWMKTHPEFLDSVNLGKAKRVATLETTMLETENATIANIRRFALVNAAPEEWREKHNIEHNEAADSPLRLLAQQISGNAIRPRLPEPKIIEHDAAKPSAIRPRQQAPSGTPRIHTISPGAYEGDE